jgi:hypothetical protein
MANVYIIQAQTATKVAWQRHYWDSLGWTKTKEEAQEAKDYLEVLNDPNRSIFQVIEVEMKEEFPDEMVTVSRKYTYEDQANPIEVLGWGSYESAKDWSNQSDADKYFHTLDPVQRWDPSRRNWKGGMYDNWA